MTPDAATPYLPPSIFTIDWVSWVEGQLQLCAQLIPRGHGEEFLLAGFVSFLLISCCCARRRSNRARTYCGCVRKDTSTVRDRLDGSTYLFLCANPCHNPILWGIGVVTSCLQLLLLIILCSRVEANFMAMYACSSVRFQHAMAASEVPRMPTSQPAPMKATEQHTEPDTSAPPKKTAKQGALPPAPRVEANRWAAAAARGERQSEYGIHKRHGDQEWGRRAAKSPAVTLY